MIFAPGSRSRNHRGDQRRGGAPREGHSLVVDEECPIGVAVECNPEVGRLFVDDRLQVHQVLRTERVGGMVGEGPVGLEVERDQLGADPLEDLGQHGARHPVPTVRSHPERPDPGGLDQ